jgi:hypothetical protein
MTDKNEKKPPDATFCRRLQRMLPLDEHAQCPYCFGATADVKDGWYDRFCDFKPGQDPINFGFPPDSSRNKES